MCFVAGLAASCAAHPAVAVRTFGVGQTDAASISQKSYSGSRATSASVSARAPARACASRRRPSARRSAAAGPQQHGGGADDEENRGGGGADGRGGGLRVGRRQRERGVVERRGARLAQVDVAPAAAVVQHLERAALAVGLAERAGAAAPHVGSASASGGHSAASAGRRQRPHDAPACTGSAPRRRRTAGAARRAAAAAAAAGAGGGGAAGAPGGGRGGSHADAQRSYVLVPVAAVRDARRAALAVALAHRARSPSSASGRQPVDGVGGGAAAPHERRQSPPHSGETCLSITGIAACPTRGERVGGVLMCPTRRSAPRAHPGWPGTTITPGGPRACASRRPPRSGLHTIPQYTKSLSLTAAHHSTPRAARARCLPCS